MIATAVLVADLTGTLDLSDRTEVRGRTTTQSVGAAAAAGTTASAAPPGLDVLTQPAAKLSATDRRWALSLSYSAAVTAPDLELGFTPQVLQTGSAAATWHDRRWTLSLREDASYGVTNSAFLVPALPAVPGQPPVATAVAPPTNILFGSTHTVGTVVDRLERRTTVTLSAEYTVSGGVDAPSRAVLPDHSGPGVTATVDHALTRVDHLLTTANAQRIDSTQALCPAPAGETTTELCQVGGELAQVEETLRHAISRSTSAMIVVGMAASGVRLQPDVPYQSTFYPVAEASYRHAFGSHVAPSAVLVYVRLAPIFDPVTGVVLNAVQGETSLANRLTRAASLHLAAGAFQNLPPTSPAATSSVRGEVSFEYTVGPSVLFSMGVRGLWQDRNGSGSFVSAFGFVAVTVRERALNF